MRRLPQSVRCEVVSHDRRPEADDHPGRNARLDLSKVMIEPRAALLTYKDLRHLLLILIGQVQRPT
jgi:hypothetical protein